MTAGTGTTSRVTLVITQRERWSYALRSLASLREHTSMPHEILYVDAGSPEPARRALAAEADRHRFSLLRHEGLLSPNQARNLAAPHVSTEYAVFLDNDVVVEPGWLENLVACADETGATLVGPIYCEGWPPGERVHMAQGLAHFREGSVHGPGRRFINEHLHAQRSRAALAPTLRRAPSEELEFHCMLVRAEAFGRLFPLDEALLSVAEHTDVCLQVRAAGGGVWFEPGAAVTYVPAAELAADDVDFYDLRWSHAWNHRSVLHFAGKWGVAPDDPWIAKTLRWGDHHRVAPRRLTRGLVRLLGPRYGDAVARRLDVGLARLRDDVGL